jgi:hypothetical protein
MYQENANGQKIGGSNTNMNSCSWSVVKDTTDPNSFVMTTTKKPNGNGCDIPANTLQFNNTLSGDTVKFDVIMKSTTLSSAAAY